MTGFGTADRSALGGRLRIEIRTVNHRYYNPQFKLPFELAGVEGPLRERLRQLLDRGHVAVMARWLEPPPGEGTVSVDLARARQLVAALKALKRKLKLKGEPDLAFVARQPDVLTIQTNGAGAVGKQLGFLAQEVLREVNTIGSKANDAAITQAVIAMKGELEKFREQLENLE